MVNARYRRLTELTRWLSATANARQVGTVQELLIEGESKTDADRMSGRTRTNRLVHVTRTARTVAGAVVNVRLTSSASHYLLGEATDLPAQPPVATPSPPRTVAPASRPRAPGRAAVGARLLTARAARR